MFVFVIEYGVVIGICVENEVFDDVECYYLIGGILCLGFVDL